MDAAHEKARQTRARHEAARLESLEQKRRFIAGVQKILDDPESTNAERLEAARLVVELEKVHF